MVKIKRRDLNSLRVYAASVTAILAAVLTEVATRSLLAGMAVAFAAGVSVLALTIPEEQKEDKKMTITYEVIDEIEAKYGE